MSLLAPFALFVATAGVTLIAPLARLRKENSSASLLSATLLQFGPAILVCACLAVFGEQLPPRCACRVVPVNFNVRRRKPTPLDVGALCSYSKA